MRRYYDRHTARFVRFGQGGGAGALHRAVRGPGVATRAQAFHYVEDRIADAIRALAPPDGAACVVDLGCGVGGSLCHLGAQLPIRGAGVTLSQVQARMARARIRAAGLQTRLRCLAGDYVDPALDLPRADLAYAIESFVHGPDPAAFFARCAQLVRPGGRLVLCDDVLRPTADPAAARAIARFRRGWRINTLLDRAGIRALAAAAGFVHLTTDDLTPHLELRRPRDRAIALTAVLVRPLPLDGALGHLTGGDALRTCLLRGWIGYDLALFERVHAGGA